MRQVIAPLLFGMLVGACQVQKQPTAAPSSSASQADATRECAVTLHAPSDVPVEGRVLVFLAAHSWRTLSQGRIRVSVEYDVDLHSELNAREHRDAGHSFLIGITSDTDIVADLDERFATGRNAPVAATVSTEDGAKVVWLILDRIRADKAQEVIAHELGHVCGMPDLPTFGSIMSGASTDNEPPLAGFSAEDLNVCRAYQLCP